MTGWSEVITNSGLLYIDDVRLEELLALSPAQFFRKMMIYVSGAMPLLTRPPILYQYISTDLVMPQVADAEWVSTEGSVSAETVVGTGAIGFDICSVCLREENEFGEIELYAYPQAAYNAETGEVTFPIQESVGLEYVIDFYKDGEFQDLTPSMLRFFGMAIAIVWFQRFDNNWLNQTMKLKDDSFQTINESNYIEKVSEKLERQMNTLNAELKKYEQDVAYMNNVNPLVRNKKLI